MDAQCELMAAGKDYPRTCPVCALGPCTRMERVPKKPYEERINDAAVLLQNYLANRVSCLVLASNVDGAKKLVDQPVWKFLGDIIGDLDAATPLGDANEPQKDE